MENITSEGKNFECKIQIGNNIYPIYDQTENTPSSEISINQILDNILILQKKSDVYIQKIIENNKFLLQAEKKPKKEEDQEEVENGEEDI
jgi:hypothetical protein